MESTVGLLFWKIRIAQLLAIMQFHCRICSPRRFFPGANILGGTRYFSHSFFCEFRRRLNRYLRAAGFQMLNAVRGDSRVGCESLMAMNQQKLDPPAAENAHTAADQRGAQARRKGGRSGNSLTFGSLSVIGLPKSAFSPGRIRSDSMRSYSGTAVSIIPREAMGKKKGGAFESEEPTSPKVTCIGRIKSKPREVSSKQQRRPGIDSREVSKCECHAKLQLPWLFRRFLSGRSKGICAPKSRVEGVKIYEPNGLGKDCVGSLESFKMDDPLPKPEFGIGPSEINLWKRRFVAKPKALDLFDDGPRAFRTVKSLTP